MIYGLSVVGYSPMLNYSVKTNEERTLNVFHIVGNTESDLQVKNLLFSSELLPIENNWRIWKSNMYSGDMFAIYVHIVLDWTKL